MSEIDVSKCEYYNFGECNRYDFPLSCTKCSNCYYKQLQQSKSKNEAIHFIADNLQKRNHRLTLKNEELEEQLQQLKAENDNLKELGRNLNALVWYIYCGSEDNVAEDAISEYYNAKNESDDIYLKNFWKKIYSLEQTEYRIKKEKYKQCINEIEEIANAIVNGTHLATDTEEHFRELTKRILQLIKQTKEGENLKWD